MAERKTHPTKIKVADFIEKVSNRRRREDAGVVAKLMRAVSGKQARMWGPSIVGFGTHHYKYADGRDAEICKIGFSPRAQALAFYLGNFSGRAALMKKLGKHKMGNGGCLYINKLDDVDMDVLKKIIEGAYNNKSGASCD